MKMRRAFAFAMKSSFRSMLFCAASCRNCCCCCCCCHCCQWLFNPTDCMLSPMCVCECACACVFYLFVFPTFQLKRYVPQSSCGSDGSLVEAGEGCKWIGSALHAMRAQRAQRIRHIPYSISHKCLGHKPLIDWPPAAFLSLCPHANYIYIGTGSNLS